MNTGRNIRDVDLRSCVFFEHLNHRITFRDKVWKKNDAKNTGSRTGFDKSQNHRNKSCVQMQPFHIPFYDGLKHISDKACHKERDKRAAQDTQKINCGQ